MKLSGAQLCLPIESARLMEEALDFAIRQWEQGRLVAGAGPFSSIAFDARRFRGMLAHAPLRDDGCRQIVMSGAIADMLHHVARGLEESDAHALARLARLMRAAADAADRGEMICVQLPPVQRAS